VLICLSFIGVDGGLPGLNSRGSLASTGRGPVSALRFRLVGALAKTVRVGPQLVSEGHQGHEPCADSRAVEFLKQRTKREGDQRFEINGVVCQHCQALNRFFFCGAGFHPTLEGMNADFEGL
jgi:hypothetical protein